MDQTEPMQIAAVGARATMPQPAASMRHAGALTVAVLSPAGLDDVDLAIAASRAGAIGILNAELGAEAGWLLPALSRLLRHGGAALGVKLRTDDPDLLSQVLVGLVGKGLVGTGLAGTELAGTGGQSRHLIVDLPTLQIGRAAIAAFRRDGGTVAVEVTGDAADLMAQVDAFDAVWLKGHEAGGWVGEQTSFILLQRFAGACELPLYVRGGINEHSAAAAWVGGAAGVVLDDQLLLLPDSRLGSRLRPKLRHFTGIETILIEQYGVAGSSGASLRIWPEPGRTEARAMAAAVRAAGGRISAEQAAQLGWGEGQVAPLGQDGAIARAWSERYGSVARALRGIADAVATLPAKAAALGLCGPGTPLARSHGTRYPIVQGPMTHVSDRVDFTVAVAAAGGLPMVAVSMMRGEALHSLLRATRDRLGDRPWGVGMLGFVPAETLAEQRAAVRETRPAWAVIAGGRPDQARELEQAGIRTYLHVPSPALLTQFLEQGARNFIFEGRECGGHIGPLASFVLWGQMIDTLVAANLPAGERERLHVLFAGGIHDARSAAMAAVMAVPLAEHGIMSGVLMGTGYIFTHEAVASGAITPEFQRIVAEATATVGLVTGPGHASRCVVTPFVDSFWERSRELGRSGASAEEVRAELDELSLGRLRLASKGVVRQRADVSGLREAAVAEQRDGGMYMIGQSCVLRDQPLSVAELHRQVGEEALALLDAVAVEAQPASAKAPAPADVAIVGMSAIFPGAADMQAFWENILAGTCSIGEIPADRWDWRLYFDADRAAPDRIYSKWGGFMPDVPFDPTRFGMPPISVAAIDPMQLLALAAVGEALRDAGLETARPEERALTSVILGMTGGLGELGVQYATRSELPRALGDGRDAPAETLAFLPDWTTDSFAGLLPNVTAGRVANRFDFGGVNFIVDAACAASLAALRLGVVELETGRSNTVICGGVDTVQGPFGFTCFSKAGALSPAGRVRTFDAAADGTTISEGIAMVVIKRLADAERDGDRVYAVIKGIAGSSDGRQRGLMAPLPAGQERALARAYAQAGYSPATVSLFEAHGTGTVAGDAAELQSLSNFLRAQGGRARQSAVGSVKTNIGHTKASAGIAGLIKASLGLHHKVLPPHMSVETPNPELARADSPVGLSQRVQPWLATDAHPRRAGVSAFGFGGTNFHVALEEYVGEFRAPRHAAPRHRWPAELFLWRADDRAAVIAAVSATSAALEAGAAPMMAALAQALAVGLGTGTATLAVVADSLATLRGRLTDALDWLHGAAPGTPLPSGTFFSDAPLARGGKLAMLFPGQGSQYPGMLRDVAACFPEVREQIEAADEILAATPTCARRDDPRLSRLIYPLDRFGEVEEKAARAVLAATDAAQPALGAVETGLLALARRLGLSADMAGGHSYGEYVALHAAGVLDRRDLLLASEARGRFIRGAARDGDLGTMAAVAADGPTVQAALGNAAFAADDVVLANFNGPGQTVISGSRAAVEAAVAHLAKGGLTATRIPVSAAFHSPLMRPAAEPLAAFLGELRWSAPKIPVYANATAVPHADDPGRIRALLGRHLTEPVHFLGMVEAMHEAGARIFLEVGPKSVLADLTRRILGQRPHRAVSFDGAGGGIAGLLHAIGALVVEGVEVDLARLFEGRVKEPLALGRLAEAGRAPGHGPNVWLLNGTRARRAGEQLQVSAKHAAPAEHAAAVPPPARATAAAPVTSPSMQPMPVPLMSRQPRPAQPDSMPPAMAARQQIILPHRRDAAFPQHEENHGMDGFYASGPEESGPQGSGDGGSLVYLPVAGADRTMAEYYQTMRQFLQVQERLMLAYLQGDTAPRHYVAAPLPALSSPMPQPVPAPVSYAAAAPPPMPMPQRPPPPAPARPVTAASATPPPTVQPTAPAPVVRAAAAAAVDPKALLLQIASDRTGYPQDMLGLDLDMEADLGIDSIKRVEILGAFRTTLPAAVNDALAGRIDDLSKAKTLQGILDLVGAQAGGAPRPFDLAGTGIEQASTPLSRHMPAASLAVAPDTAAEAPLQRYVIASFAEALPAAGPDPLPGGLYVIVPDDLGVADALGHRLETAGVLVRRVPPPALASEDALGRWLGVIRAEDRVRAVIDLRAVRRATEAMWDDPAAWRAGMEQGVKALFPLLRLCASDLAATGTVIAASGMGGLFGRDAAASGRALFPGDGGAVGLLKCLSIEWTDCAVRAVDLDLDQPAEMLAAHLHAELACRVGRREVGYPAGARTIFRTVPSSLMPQQAPLARPNGDWVVLAIGGARGITAETLRGFAKAGATCVLVGRAALPDAEEPSLGGLADAAALRGHFLAAAKAAGERPRPVELEARIAAVLRDREIRANLADFASFGARVDYRICDVRDDAAASGLLAALYAEYGRLDAVLFGAGLIEDQLLVDKSQASMSRVFDTKVMGAYALTRHLRPETLKFVALFASVTGRYGNRGQTDYGAANEVLNRLAWLLSARFGSSVKVCAVNWGPWARTTHGAGMLTPETARQFRARGVSLIEPGEGGDFLLRELLYGPRDQVEVVAGEHPWEYKEAAAAAGAAALLPVPQPLLPASAVTGASRLRKTIDLVSDPYLDDHRLDGRPVLPIACATEYMAEAAALLSGRPVQAITGVRNLRGLVLEDRLDIEIEMQPSADGGSAAVQLRLAGPRPHPCYQATVVFGPPGGPKPGRASIPAPTAAPRGMGAAYRDMLFHGPRFQTIDRVTMLGAERIVATGHATRPAAFYPPAGDQDWIFDPGIIDGFLQLLFLWALEHRQSACLPAGFGRIARYGDAAPAGELSFAIDLTGLEGDAFRYRAELADSEGRVLLTIEDGEAWLNPGLMRLRGGWAGGVPAAPTH